MILIPDIEEAFKTDKVLDCSATILKSDLIKEITEYAVRIGQSQVKPEFIAITADLFSQDLKKYYKHLHVGEIMLSIKLLAFGELGDRRHVSTDTFRTAVDLFLNCKERAIYKEKKTKEEIVGNLQLPAKTVWTEEERMRILDARYIECWNLVVNGREPRDTGGLLWDFLESKALVQITLEDIQDEYESKLEALMLNKFDTYTRDLLKHHRECVSSAEKSNKNPEPNESEKIAIENIILDKSPLVPFAKARILKQYFLMEIEASEIKRLEVLNKKTA